MAKEIPSVYWDACCILGLLKGEKDKITACQSIVRLASEDKIHIHTSALTQVEVLHLGRKDGLEIPVEDREIVRRFFDEPFITLHAADRWITRDAQELFWEYPGLKWKDAVHAATAMRRKVLNIHTYDPDFLPLNGVVGNPPLVITKPGFAHGPLFSAQEG